ncbi:MAG: deaminase [Alphaproteobacteria bacterium]
MEATRRAMIFGAGVVGAGAALAMTRTAAAAEAPASLPADERARHERAMRLAIAEARRNPRWPFGAVITDGAGQVVAAGVNDSRANPTFHGEVAAMNDYVARHGNSGWADRTLYTTGEPCPMCMAAIAWAGIGAVVWGTSIATLTRHMRQIAITADQVAAAAGFYKGRLIGGVLEAECDALFRDRPPA